MTWHFLMSSTSSNFNREENFRIYQTRIYVWGEGMESTALVQFYGPCEYFDQ